MVHLVGTGDEGSEQSEGVVNQWGW